MSENFFGRHISMVPEDALGKAVSDGSQVAGRLGGEHQVLGHLGESSRGAARLVTKLSI